MWRVLNCTKGQELKLEIGWNVGAEVGVEAGGGREIPTALPPPPPTTKVLWYMQGKDPIMTARKGCKECNSVSTKSKEFTVSVQERRCSKHRVRNEKQASEARSILVSP